MTKTNEDVKALATVTPATTELTVESLDPALQELFGRLPASYQGTLLKVQRPTTAEVSAALAAVKPEEKELLVDLVDRLQASTDFKPTTIKLFQGVGNDATRPAKLPPGNYYSTGSVDLGSDMVIAVLRVWETRVLWPPKDAESSAPVCASVDGKFGDRYGSCAACPNLKRKYTEGGCMPQITMWFTDEKFTGIYEFTFSKTALKGGQALRTMATSDRRSWFRWMKFTAEERVNGDKRWFVPKASPVQDAKKPELNTTNPELREVFRLLSSALEVDVFLQRVARQHNRNTEDADGATPATGEGAGKELDADVSDADFGGANTGL